MALLLAVSLLPFAVSCLGTWALIGLLRRRAVLDLPNERSSHVAPTPRGGGIAVIGAIALAWLTLRLAEVPSCSFRVIAAMLALAAVSWTDDLRGLSAGWRLAAQVAAVAVGMSALPQGLIFQGWLPPTLDVTAAALLWVWFINLFNFMDGIDGIAASEAAAIGIGLFLVSNPNDAVLALPIVAAAAGFLLWNWSPARIFLGDVGSVPLGYILGFLLYKLALQWRWQAALILPLYFFADATITLLRRLLRGERVWQAHREHFYQRAVQQGLSHAAVVWRVLAADVVLIACAVAAMPTFDWRKTSLVVAGITVAGLLFELGRNRRPG